MKAERQKERIKQTGQFFIERIDSVMTKFGEGTVERIWLDDNFLGYRVRAGYRKIWGDVCFNIKDAIDFYELREGEIRTRIKEALNKVK